MTYHRPYNADRIEREHDGMRLPDIIKSYRDAGTSWNTIAGVFGVNYNTLKKWREYYGLEIDGRKKVYDFAPGREPIDGQLAEQHGYKSFDELAYDWRMTHKMTVKQCADKLGVSTQTVRKFTPSGLKGYRHITPRLLETATANLVKARQAQDKIGRTGLDFRKQK
jgi:transposase-like protein